MKLFEGEVNRETSDRKTAKTQLTVELRLSDDGQHHIIKIYRDGEEEVSYSLAFGAGVLIGDPYTPVYWKNPKTSYYPGPIDLAGYEEYHKLKELKKALQDVMTE